MRKISVLLFTGLILLIVSACEGPTEDDQRLEQTDLKIYLESVDMPKNLSITFDPAKVNSVTSAKKYTAAAFLELDADTVAKKLLRNDITEKKPMAEGPYFIAKSSSIEEYLIVYDGGKGFGIKGVTNGGLTYTVFKNGEHTPTLIANSVGPPNLSEQSSKSMRRSDYSSTTDLSFASRSEALASVEELLSSIGFSEFKLIETYTMDLKTMKEHYNYYLEEMGSSENVLTYNLTVDDEAYMFHFRQQIDELPVNSTEWTLGKGTAEGPADRIMTGNPFISVTYQKHGVGDISAANFFDITNAKAGETESLISAVDAMKMLLGEYKDLILEEGTQVSSAELLYVSVPAKGGKEEAEFELIPAWVFTITKPQYFEGSVRYNDYSQYVVNAITGEKLSGMR